MNDQQFLERAHANPHDDSPDFLQAAASSPERQQLLAELLGFDGELRHGLESISAPEGLRQSLLDIPEGDLHPDTESSAANDSFWRRNFQYAAGLIVAVGVLAIVFQGQADPMEELVFTHIYSELNFLEDDSHLTLEDVNAVMNSQVGTAFSPSPEMARLDISVTKDCWVDIENGVKGVHMVMQGDVGRVTVMVIPNSPVAEQMNISDDRFAGIISPTPGGNLVVIGEKDESIQQYSTLLAGNINW